MKLKWKTAAAGGGIAVAVVALAWFATQRGPLAPVTVQTAPVSVSELQRSVFGIGTVEARYTYAIGPTQAGRVLRVLVDHGDRVKAGQLLAEIDPIDLEQRLSAAEAALQRAHYGVVVAEAQVREAESRHRVASANAARYRDLAQRQFVSKEAADSRGNEADTAQAALEAARAALLGAQRDAERAQQERNGAARQLASLKLVSPVSGVVIAREAEPGNTVVAGQAVVRIIDPDSVWVRARIDQSRAYGLQLGLPADVVLRSGGGTVIPAQVARVEIQSDAVTEEKIVAVSFVSPPGTLSLGDLAEVTIRHENGVRGFAIPTAAVTRSEQRTGVWQVVDGKTHFRALRLGVQTLDGRTQVIDGLAEGESVVVYSSAQLREGMSVRIRNAS